MKRAGHVARAGLLEHGLAALEVGVAHARDELRLLRRAEAGEARVGLEQPRLALQRGRLRRAHHLQVLGPLEHGELARRESDYLLVAAAGRGVVGGEGGGDGASEGRRRRTRGEDAGGGGGYIGRAQRALVEQTELAQLISRPQRDDLACLVPKDLAVELVGDGHLQLTAQHHVEPPRRVARAHEHLRRVAAGSGAVRQWVGCG
jgi:hypothetical protein